MKPCRAITLAVWLLPAAVGLAVGCDKDDGSIKQYEIARVDDAPAGETAAPATAAPAAGSADVAPVRWTVPAGWRQLPGDGMRYASFAVSSDHPALQLTVIPLPAAGGALLPNVNRWENQLGLPPSSQDDLAKELTRIDAAGTPIDVFDRTAAHPADRTAPKRILAAMAGHGDQIWFFKLAGPADQVEAQAGEFQSFIRSIRFTDASPGSAASVGSGEASASAPIRYAAPPGWAAEPPEPDNPFRVAAFTIPGQPTAGEVVITHVDQNSGTMLENINRWRGQLSLDPLADATQAPTQALQGTTSEAAVWMFDNAAIARSMRVAMITQGGQWWIFKLAGPSALVADQQSAFDTFVMSVQFAGEGQ